MIVSPMLAYRQKKDGTHNIQIYLYHNLSRSKAVTSTEYYVKEDEWNGSVKKSRPNYQHINAALKSECMKIEHYWLKNEGLTAKQVKEWYESPKSPRTGVIEYYRYYLELCETGKLKKKRTKTVLSESYIKSIRTSLRYIEKFAVRHPVTFEIIDEDWYDKYVEFLRMDLLLNQNTIGKAIKLFKAVCAHAKKNNLHNNEGFKDYSIATVKPYKVKLNPEEVQRIIDLDLSDEPELKSEQERFEIAYNLLLRYGDSVDIREDNVIYRDKKYYLSTKTQKTQQQILLPIKKSVYEILKRNKFKIKSANSKSNKKLKILGMRAKINENVPITEYEFGLKKVTVYKKYELIETHTTRRSAARNLYDSGMDPLIIMVLGGWSTLKQLLEYIDIDLDYAASKAANHPFFK